MKPVNISIGGEIVATNGGRVFSYTDPIEAEEAVNLCCGVQAVLTDHPGDVGIVRDGNMLAIRSWNDSTMEYDDWERMPEWERAKEESGKVREYRG